MSLEIEDVVRATGVDTGAESGAGGGDSSCCGDVTEVVGEAVNPNSLRFIFDDDKEVDLAGIIVEERRLLGFGGILLLLLL